MIVLSLVNCPAALRGDLTKWLLEISSGVFVGQLSARVRDMLWDRVQSICKNGRAIMVYSVNNEQRMAFRVIGETWEPIDFDGIRLMLRPSAPRKNPKGDVFVPEISKAAQRRTQKRVSAARAHVPESYVVIDVETTGLNPETDEIIELGALKVTGHVPGEKFCALVKTTRPVPTHIEKLTGITARMILEQGEEPRQAYNAFFAFVGNRPIVAHNVSFDRDFLRAACARYTLPMFANRCIDTLALARRVVRGARDYQLTTLCQYFDIAQESGHRVDDDCRATQLLLDKLINLMKSGSDN